ncbi:MAG: hypothetical protein MJK04_16490, partial [Psychrosphaera sp.]|nr:hypothetical protein [Psychrosphaera sp.]
MNDNHRTKRQFVAPLSKTALCLAVALSGSLVASQSFAKSNIDNQYKGEPQRDITVNIDTNQSLIIGAEYNLQTGAQSSSPYVTSDYEVSHMGNSSSFLMLTFDSNERKIDSLLGGSAHGSYDGGIYSVSADVSAHTSSLKDSTSLGLTIFFKINGKKDILHPGTTVADKSNLNNTWDDHYDDLNLNVQQTLESVVGLNDPLV